MKDRAPGPARFEDRGEGRLALAGILDRTSAASVLAEGRRRWSALPPGRSIDLDLSGLERVDSSALAVLVDWKRWARGEGRSLAYLGAPPTLVALARLSGIADLFEPEGRANASS